MRKLKIGVIDLVTNGSTRTLWARTVYAKLFRESSYRCSSLR